MNRLRTHAIGALLLALLTTGCGSSGMGDILGGNTGATGSSAGDVRGTVYDINTRDRFITLTNVDPRKSSGLVNGGNDVRIYFDDRTTVNYQGATYRAEDLERGDQIAVRVAQSGDRYMATSIEVLYDSSRGASNSNDNYGNTVRGVVRNVDASRRTVEIDGSGMRGGTRIIEFDANTVVYFNNRTYRPQDLERGDEIEVVVRDTGNNRYLADRISVVRSANGTSGTTGSSNSSTSTVRGTVRYVDTNRRTIELEQATWSSNFQTGGSTVVLTYDTSTQVEFQGRMHPIANLERGDVVDVRVRPSGSTNMIERIVVVRDANSF